MARSNWTSQLIVVALVIVAMLPHVPRLIELITGSFAVEVTASLAQIDFVNYWLAARLTLDGQLHLLYDFSVYFAKMEQIFGSGLEVRAWSYPPHYLLFLWPLAMLEYLTSIWVFQATGLVFFGLAIYIASQNLSARAEPLLLVALLVPYCSMQLAAMQNGFYFAAVMILGFVFSGTRPWLAGLCFAVLTIKPQLGIMVPIYLIAIRDWRTIIATVIITAALLASTAVVFGIDQFTRFIQDTLPFQTSVMHEWHGSFLFMMPTVFAGMRVLGFGSEHAELIHYIWAATFILPLIGLVLSIQDPDRKIFAAIAATFLLSPYSFSYDMGAFAAIAALLAIKATPGSRDRFYFALAAVMPATILPFGQAGLPVTPFVLLVFLFWSARREVSAFIATIHRRLVAQ